jgi:acyl-CoA thioesterase-1
MAPASRRTFIRSATLAGLSLPLAGAPEATRAEGNPTSGADEDCPLPTDDYLEAVRQELQKKWPQNRTVNLVFHGHSVPAGYFQTPVVNTLESYPFLVLKGLKARYPLAVINSIVTSIGGEDSKQGAERFEREVLCHRPDVLFIDYALNDQRIGLQASMEAWSRMIASTLEKNIKVILMTATPDQRVDIMDKGTLLQKNCDQIAALASKYKVGLVDSYRLFQDIHASGGRIADYMSQVNHPNEKGHRLVADAILGYF